jgi:hypothetical protein
MKPWPADKVERMATLSLVPSARNARLHSDAQIEQIMASIREWGWTTPVLVDERGVIIAGHGRVMAAERMELAEVPVIVARGWSEAQKRSYLIADNKLPENASWDQSLLQLEFADLKQLGFDGLLTGFTENEIEAFGLPENNPLAEWVGMPEFQQNAKNAFRTLIVHFKDAEAVQQFCQQVGQQLTDKTKFIWVPPVDDESYVEQQFQSAAE